MPCILNFACSFISLNLIQYDNTLMEFYQKKKNDLSKGGLITTYPQSYSSYQF